MDRLSPTKRPDGPPAGYHRWRSLLFLHWQVPVEQLRPLIHPRLSIDTFDGKALVGLVPFTMEGIRPTRFLPPVPGVSAFHETNVRTYVHLDGEAPGVWFFSLDAANAVAVAAARAGWSLPYFLATMSLEQDGSTVRYATRRRYPPPTPAELEITYEIGEDLGTARPDTLEHFLAERYYLYTAGRGDSLIRGQVHHTPYPLRRASVGALRSSMLEAAGLTPTGEMLPPLYSPGVDVEVFALESV